ncbi:hypothetical protein [Bradyrhizobium sp. 30]|uniref:hypothetical protein n=1 Tax=Bradyrhizobium sp. 30 TaxID=2782669 RepID=UPI001FFAE1FA|nr:hypothetical protein [Bradyrhizobium sp. 30]MCK1292039.1 hypothetical protein [Bradyrhizobium sp. 30]
MFLYGNIGLIFDIVGGLFGRKEIEEFADLSRGYPDVTRLGSPNQLFGFGEDLFDGFRSGLWAAKEQMRPLGADGIAREIAIVTS